MAGNRIGGLKAKIKNLERDPDFYKRIGSKGGSNGKGPDYKGGFAADRERARIAGAKGGRKSTRKGIKNGQGKIHQKEA